MQKLINKRSIVIDYLMIVGTGLLAAAIQCLYDPDRSCHRRFYRTCDCDQGSDRKICAGRNPTLADQYRAECATVFSDSEV